MSIYLCCCGIPPDENNLQPPTRPNTPAKEKVTFSQFMKEDQLMRRKTVSNIATEVLNTEKK